MRPLASLFSWILSQLGKGLQPCACTPVAYFEVRRWRLCLSSFKVMRKTFHSDTVLSCFEGRVFLLGLIPSPYSLLKLASLWRVEHKWLDLSIFGQVFLGHWRWISGFQTFLTTEIQQDEKPCDHLLYHIFPLFTFCVNMPILSFLVLPRTT